MPKGVYERGPSRAKPRRLRTLRPGEPRPAGEPRRYPDRDGYIRLRWRVGPSDYVEIREHRAIAAHVDGIHVHHIDHDPGNNDPSNLVILTKSEHARLHGRELQRFDREEARHLYELGYSTPQIGRMLGVDQSNVYRGLKAIGVRFRPLGTRSYAP